jgi:hypothetical protein
MYEIVFFIVGLFIGLLFGKWTMVFTRGPDSNFLKKISFTYRGKQIQFIPI